MKVTLVAEWKSYESPLHSDYELNIGGLFASVSFLGDMYEWRVAAEGNTGWGSLITEGVADNFSKAKEAAEEAIHRYFDKKGLTG